MNRRQYIFIGAALIIVILAVWLVVKFWVKKPVTAIPNNNQAISLEKTTYKDRITMLKSLFAEKSGKAIDNVSLNIAREDNTHIKGIVTIKDDYEGVFLALRANGDWQIIWDGKGQYPCANIQGYDFPGVMVSDCLK